MECCNILTHIVYKVLKGQKLKDVLDNLKVEEILDNQYKEQYEDNPSQYESVKSLILSKLDNSGNDWNWRTTKIYKYNKERAKKKPSLQLPVSVKVSFLYLLKMAKVTDQTFGVEQTQL